MKKTICLATILLLVTAAFSGCGDAIKGVDDLVGKKIAIQNGTTGESIASDIKDAEVRSYSKGSDVFKSLEDDKVEAVIIDSETAISFSRTNTELKILSNLFDEERYSIAFNKNCPELGAKIDNAITELKEEGTFDKIVSHWIGDSPDHIPYRSDTTIERTGKLIMATNAEFPPYESYNEGQIVGIDVDIMNAVCDKLGMELYIENMAFSNVISAVVDGSADVGVAAITVTPEREEEVDFTQSYASSNQVVVVKK